MPLWMALVIAVGGGVLTEFGFPGRLGWPAAIFGVGLLWVSLRDATLPRAALIGAAWSLVFFSLHWIWVEDVVSIVPWGALSLAESAFVVIMCMVWVPIARLRWLSEHHWAQALAFAALFVAVEEVRSRVPFGGFPWGRIGFSQTDGPLAAWAWLAGAPLVSFLAVTSGVLLMVALGYLLRRRMLAAGGAVASAAAVMCGGLLVPLSAAAESGSIRVAAVQGNIPDAGLDSFSERRQVLNNHLAQTLKSAEHADPVDLIVWPENASDIDPLVDDSVARDLNNVAETVGAPIVVGTMEYDGNARTNVSLVWAAGQGSVDSYEKRHPVPFAEYIPWRSVARFFSAEVDRVNVDMVAGTGSAVLNVPDVVDGQALALGSIICFEVAYDDLVRSAVEDGAQLLTVQTNNANFGRTNESVQQLAMSRLRAIETGRVVIHISTVGVSGIFAPDGTELARSGHFTAETLTATVPLRDSRTPAMSAMGPFSIVIQVVSLSLAIVAVVVGWRQRKMEKND